MKYFLITQDGNYADEFDVSGFRLVKFKSEKEILKLSIFSTIFLAILGLIFGLLASSATIIFDSIYGMIDALMTIFR